MELARDIAGRFNGIYGNVFKVPEPYIAKTGAKVMSLQEPEKKMSKSDSNANAFISMLDSTDDIIRKFKRAVTDSDSRVAFSEDKPGISNLMGIYSAVTGKTFPEIEAEFSGRGYGDFKLAVGEAVDNELRPIREEFNRLIADKAYLEQVYKAGAEKAQRLSGRTVGKAMKKIGFVL